MREVPVLLFRSMRRALERYGLHTASHLEGLSLAKVPAWAVGGRVDWDELATFLERCAGHLEPAEQERVGELYPLENHYLQFIARSTLSPRLLHQIAWGGTTLAFPHLDIGIDELTDRHVVVHIALPRTHRGSSVFFRATTGECRTITEILGLGPSEIEADIGPWHGRYAVRFPSTVAEDELRAVSRRLLGDRQWKLPILIAWLFGHARDEQGDEVGDRLQRVHGLSATQAALVVRIGQGVSVAEIAHELGLRVSDLEVTLERDHERLSDAVRAELVLRAGRATMR